MSGSDGELRGRVLPAVTFAAVAALAVAASAAGARVAQPETTSCTAKFIAGALHLCGPATAHLSVFGRYTFRNGTCKRSVVAGESTLVLELGVLKSGSRTNGGFSYFKIEIDGPLSHPTGGHVISWHNGKRWSGYGQSFRGNARGGTFVATRTATGGGRATGSFRCSG
jgi:hypothetical protein